MTRPVSGPPAPGTPSATPPALSRHGATQGATGGNGAQVAAGGPSGPRVDPVEGVGLEATLRRIAALHGDLAHHYGILAEEVGIRLAGCAKSSLTATMPVKPPTKTTPDPTLITAGELAEILQCHPRTIRRMELAGELPSAIKNGRLKRWQRPEIQEWLDARPSPRTGRRSSR